MIETAYSAITKMTIADPIPAFDPILSTDLIDIQAWCLWFSRHCKHKATILNRFAIGFYQIYQGIEWKDRLNSGESYCSAFLHFLMVCEELELPLEKYLMIDLKKYPKIYIDQHAVMLLKSLSRSQQQLFYANKVNKTARKSRYNKDTLTLSMNTALSLLISLVEPEDRRACIYEASSIMTKDLK